VPEAVSAEIVRLDVPVLFKVIVCDPLLPREVFPKVTLVGFAVSADWMPVPVMATVIGEDGVLLVIEILPDGLPVLGGAKVAVIGALPPAAIEIGNVNPLTE
jgi:hypothetical protein